MVACQPRLMEYSNTRKSAADGDPSAMVDLLRFYPNTTGESRIHYVNQLLSIRKHHRSQFELAIQTSMEQKPELTQEVLNAMIQLEQNRSLATQLLRVN